MSVKISEQTWVDISRSWAGPEPAWAKAAWDHMNWMCERCRDSGIITIEVWPHILWCYPTEACWFMFISPINMLSWVTLHNFHKSSFFSNTFISMVFESWCAFSGKWFTPHKPMDIKGRLFWNQHLALIIKKQSKILLFSKAGPLVTFVAVFEFSTCNIEIRFPIP